MPQQPGVMPEALSRLTVPALFTPARLPDTPEKWSQTYAAMAKKQTKNPIHAR